MTTAKLSCARHLLLRKFLHNPFVSVPILQYVLLDYIHMACEDETITQDFAKKKLVEVESLSDSIDC